MKTIGNQTTYTHFAYLLGYRHGCWALQAKREDAKNRKYCLTAVSIVESLFEDYLDLARDNETHHAAIQWYEYGQVVGTHDQGLTYEAT